MKKYIYPSIVIICLFVPALRYLVAALFAGIIFFNAAKYLKKKLKRSGFKPNGRVVGVQ